MPRREEFVIDTVPRRHIAALREDVITMPCREEFMLHMEQL